MSGIGEVIGGIAAVTQIATQILQVVSLLAEIKSNMKSGPGSIQEQDKMIQKVVDLVTMIQENHSGDALARAFTEAFLQDAQLLHKSLHGLSINAADGVMVRLKKSLLRKFKERDISKLEARLDWAMATINACQGAYTNAMINDMYNVIVRKEKTPLTARFLAGSAEPCFTIFKSTNRRPFVGREKLLELLRLKLESEKLHTRVALYGLPGIGKTRTAHEYAHQLQMRATSTSIFLINAETQSSFESDFLKIGSPTATGRQQTKEDIHDMLISKITGEWLMIVDNANDRSVFLGQKNLFRLIPNSTNGSVIFITRDRNTAVEFVGVQNLEMVDTPSLIDAKKLLLSLMVTSELTEKDTANINELLAALDYHPFLICYASSFISTNSISITEYLGVYFKDAISITDHLSEALNRSECRSFCPTDDMISTSWFCRFEATFERIRRDNSQAADILSFMACVSNLRVPKPLLYSEKLPSKQIDQSKALQNLKAHCLITSDRDDEVFTMPYTVRLAIRKWLNEHRSLDSWVNTALDSVYEEFPDVQFDEATLKVCDVYFVHAEAVLDHDQQCAEKLDQRAKLALRCSKYLMMKGRYNRAETFAKKAAEWSAKGLGETDEKTLVTLSNWAEVLRHLGRFDRAWEIDSRVLEHRIRLQGKSHLATLATMNSLGSAMYGLGHYREAAQMYNEVFRRRKAIMGRKDCDTLISMGNLCRSLASMGKYNAAEKIVRKLVRLKTDVLGAKNPSTLISKETLGLVLRQKGDFAEAEKLFNDVLIARKELYREDTHPSVLSTLGNIVAVLDDQNKLQEALDLAQEVLSASIRVHGTRHPDTIRNTNNLSEIFLRLGDFGQAELLKRQVLKDRQEILGLDHPDTEYADRGLRRLLAIKKPKG